MFAGYQILGEISRGGMGVVYRVRHPQLNKEMALKVILKPNSDLRLTERFKREAQALGQLRHPNILAVSDFGYENGAPYLVMDFIEGEDLEAVLSRAFKLQGEVDLDWLLPKLKDLADALSHCHENGITHRDLKPANILIEKETERLVLIDFGLVKEEERPGGDKTAELSLTGEMIGTPEYMSPEQFDKDGEFGRPGPASDVWSFGVLLYYCLSGKKPFSGDTIYNYCVAILKKEPKALKVISSDYPSALLELVNNCLQKPQEARPTMDEIDCILEETIENPDGELFEEPSKNSWFWIVPVMTLLLTFSLGALYFQNQDNIAPTVVWGAAPDLLFEKNVTLSGTVSEVNCSLSVNGDPVPIKDLRFQLTLPLLNTETVFRFELNDAAGNLQKYEKKLKRCTVIRVSNERRDGVYNSIGKALKISPSNVLIELEPGVYQESVTLSKGRRIISSDRSKTVVWRAKEDCCLRVMRGKSELQGIRLEASGKDQKGVILEGGELTLTDGYVSSSRDIGILVKAKGAKFVGKRSVIDQCGNTGLHVEGKSKAILRDCKISKSGFRNIDCKSGAEIELIDCQISRATNVGIVLRSSTLKATRCEIFENYGVGIRAVSVRSWVSFIDMRDCKVRNNRASLKNQKTNRYKGSGLSFSTGSKVKLENCQLFNNEDHGLILGAGVGVIKNCQAYSNGVNGFYTYGSIDAKFIDCRAEENRQNGFFSAKKSKVSFTRCKSYKNGRDGFSMWNGSIAELNNCQGNENGESGIAFVNEGAKGKLNQCETVGNKYGSFVTGQCEMTATGLVSKDNKLNGLVSQDGSRVFLYSGTVLSNGTQDLCILKSSQIIAKASKFDPDPKKYLAKDASSKLTIIKE